jgi:predicted nucleotidyltransferase
MNDLPEQVGSSLTEFLAAAQTAFGDRLSSAVLFGSAAEGRMRPTSDVNLILVLTEFVPADFERLTPSLRLARAAIRLEAMFLLVTEIPAAVECFAQKFADIVRRRRVLYGPDPFADVRIPRPAEIFRLKQVLLNLALRLRESYAERADRLDQIALLIAETAGPLRASAATLLELENGTVQPPKEALEGFVEATPRWKDAAQRIADIREQRAVAPEALPPALFAILEIADALRRRAESLQ